MIKRINFLFGQNIIAAREKKGLTRPQLAKKIGCDKHTIYMYERDKRCKNPDIYLLIKLSRALGVSMDYILTGKYWRRYSFKEYPEEVQVDKKETK